MQNKHEKSLFIFRRDLRLNDNTGLNTALNDSTLVIPCFIFDPRQYKKNDYFTGNGFKFLLQCLKELDSDLKENNARLYIFNGKAEEVISELIKKEKIDAVYFNRDYTPFSRKRDQAIYKTCKSENINTHQFADCLLNEPEDACKDDGNPYTVFTPYFKKNSLKTVKPVKKLISDNFLKEKIKSEHPELIDNFLSDYNQLATLPGGRTQALKILKSLSGYKDYQDARNYLIHDATTHLSAHNKFGTVSIREVYHAFCKSLGSSHSLVRQLYWRDFFTHIGFHFPHVFGGAFNKKYDLINWENDEKKFKVWCDGKTGFPIVDAAMNEINSTGFMHNRARMVVASFLVKDLHIDWRWGEQYFSSKLVDYDPAVNNGSWQWAASTGCDAQPYFRIFNPWLQQQKFDSDCLYIKKWLPQLKDIPNKVLHNLFKNNQTIAGYPAPIVEHSEVSSKAKKMFEI